ncbi:hypothetical protein ABIF26_004454 [Bradyrhizobium elkanii]|uniref:hypothetical protein n=1 Tax=Bradyrhizobium elkanii TaxID=29448 RepID=UPI0035186B8E
MCEKCIELDEKIEHYRAVQSRITDEIALEGITELIAELLDKKAKLHPDQPTTDC